MADSFTIRVNTPGVEPAIKKLEQLNVQLKEAQAYSSKPITIGVNTAGAAKGVTALNTATKQTGIVAADAVKKFAAWYAIAGVVTGVTGAFKDALTTMKAVDAQLTNIQKVSGMSAQSLKQIGDAAYEVASQYGVAADEYLSAVYTFQKAGLGTESAKLGELATKTMLVGDTTADVASQFLIATNAAWNMGGSVEKLSMVVDQADYINNNYATSLDKLSEGMPIVASTAANMNMSVEETMAVLGTITAKTQESGRKAATAWRALAMNLAGELGTITDETGESIEVTEASVKSVSDALKIYGNESVKAAQATGQVINPMDAVVSLAEAYRDGLLNDIQLQDILMNVGGKLRTNQLTTLVRDLASDTSTYRDILEHLPGAMGTADAEIGIKLSSWESKTQILKNTWTEFISHMANTGAIKGMVDGLTAVVNILDTVPGRIALTVAGVVALASAFTSLGKAALASNAIQVLTSKLMSLGTVFQKLFMGGMFNMKNLGTALGALVKTIGPAGTVVLGLTAIYGLYKGISALTVTTQESVSRYTDFVAEKQALEDELATLQAIKDSGGAMTAEERNRLAVLQQQTAELEKQAEAERQKLINAAGDALGEGWTAVDTFAGAYTGTNLGDIETLKEYGVAIDEADLQTKRMASSITAMRQTLSDLAPVYEYLTDEQKAQYDGMSELVTAYDAGGNALTAFMEAIANGYTAEELAAGKVKEYNDALAETQAANEAAAAAAEEHASALSPLEQNIQGATAALQEFNEALKGGDQDDAFKGYAEAYKALMDEIEAGRTNSNTFNSAAELLFGDLDQFDGDVDKIIERAEQVKELFGDADSAGWGLVDTLAEMADASGNVYDEQGNLLASLEETDEGYNLQINDLEALADQLGISTEAMQALDSALAVFGVETGGIDDLLGIFDELGIRVVELDDGLKHIDASQLEYVLSQAGYTKEEIQNVETALQAANDVSLDGAIQGQKDVADAAQTAKGKEDEAKSAADLLKAALERITSTSLSNASSAASTLKSALDSARSSAVALQNQLNSLHMPNLNFAEGTDSAPGGPALVNEYGPEIIKEGGEARIAGGGYPTVTNLKPGAKVYTAEETRKMLEGNAFFQYGKAFGGKNDDRKAGNSPTSSYHVLRGPKKTTTKKSSKKGGKSSGKSGGKSSGKSGGKSGGGSSTKKSGGGSSSSGGGSSSSDDEDKEKREGYKNQIDLLESELKNLEKTNATMDVRIAKQRELQGAIHDYAEYLRSTDPDGKDVKTKKEIVDLSNDWLDVQEDITDSYGDLKKAEQEEYEKNIDLQEARLKNLEAQNAPWEERVAQMREVQKSYHEMANYLRGQGASEEEILELSTKWYKVQQDITDEYEKERERLEKIAEELQKELERAIDAELDRAKKARDEELAAIDAELERMRKRKEVEKESLALQEKKKAVLEAQQKALDAQDERTVRIFNAEKNQWEWIADQSKVNDAKEAYSKAKKDLSDYKDELAYNAAVDALNARKDAINSAYDALEEEMKGIVKAFEEPARDIATIMADAAENSFPRVKDQIDDLATALDHLNNYINAATGNDTGDSFDAGSRANGGAGGGPIGDYKGDKTDYSALMEQAKTYDEFKYWENERNKKIAAQGIDLGAAGFRTNEEIYASKFGGKAGGTSSGGSSASGGASLFSEYSLMTTQDRDIKSGLLTRNRQTATSGVLSSTRSNSSINSGTNIIINGLEVHDKAAVGAFKAFLESSNTLSVYASQMA